MGSHENLQTFRGLHHGKWGLLVVVCLAVCLLQMEETRDQGAIQAEGRKAEQEEKYSINSTVTFADKKEANQPLSLPFAIIMTPDRD